MQSNRENKMQWSQKKNQLWAKIIIEGATEIQCIFHSSHQAVLVNQPFDKLDQD